MKEFKDIKYVFWGTGHLAESTLMTLCRAGNMPVAIVTKPDSKQGRNQELTSPMIKRWAEVKGIKVLQPNFLKVPLNQNSKYSKEELVIIQKEVDNFIKEYKSLEADVAIVASYGKIIPENILNIPTQKTLNVHPSLLPLYRGPSPIQTAMLEGANSTAVTIMQLDSEMDHGPILMTHPLNIHESATAESLEIEAGQLGGQLLIDILEHYVNGNLIAKEQDHNKATYCKYINKEDGEIKDIFINDFQEDSKPDTNKSNIKITNKEQDFVKNKLTLTEQKLTEIKTKYKALYPWPGIYFIHAHNNKNIRIKISKINLSTGEILKVIPEGKSEMDFESFLNGYTK